MRSASVRLLALILALQQLGYSLPAGALVNAQTGLPVDAPALARHSLNVELGVEARKTTGDATYRIAILTPPGTGGHTPSVSLVYSSGDTRRSGPVGVGWQLDIGPATIERSTRDGAPRYDASDSFELGGQRLRATAIPGRYVSENHDFSRIERIGSSYWRVLRPDGTRLYYGFAPGPDPLTGSILYNSLVRATDPTPAVCPNPWASCTTRETIVNPLIPFAWYLDRIEDRNGNVIRLTWEDLGDRGMRYLAAITYSEHVSGSPAQVPSFGGADDGSLTRERAIIFEYNLERTDVLPTYRTGFPRQISYRLEQIDVGVDGALVRRYQLEYDQSPASGRSRLRAVRERDASGTTANELVTEFDYGEGGAPVGGSFWSAKDSRWTLPAGLQFVASGADQGIRLVDVNTDGYPDVVRARSGARQTYLGGPSGFDNTPTSQWALPFDVVDSSGYTGAVFGDFDGDGRQDVLRRLIQITGTNAYSQSCGSSGTNRHHEVVNGSPGSFLQNDARINTGAGWVADATQTRGSVRYTTTKLANFGDANSCPYEYLPFADRVSGISAGFDQAARVVDMNGDGRDDIVFYRDVVGAHSSGGSPFLTDETRGGTLLNSPLGLAAGTLNLTHISITEGPSFSVFHTRSYDAPRWQVPDYGAPPGTAWSILNTCKASGNALAGSHTGRERLIDLNTDGLPDILEHTQGLVVSGGSLFTTGPPYVRQHINNGYGWKLPSVSPETSFVTPLSFYAVAGGDYSISSTTCTDLGGAFAVEQGTRMLDINGDGGPDAIGLLQGEGALLWSAELQVVAGVPDPLFWHPVSAWNTPVTFRPSTPPPNTYGIPPSEWNGPPGGARFADVNNDGMVDIVVSDGAYLNLGEPPDMLETVRSPHGAVTSLDYEPHTVFGAAPRINLTTNGQYIQPQARWVVTRIDVDPGPAFGQPVVGQEFQYYAPVYDAAERSFRGFQEVVTLGAIHDGIRAATETSFHTSDALRGRVARVLISSVNVNGQPGNPGVWDWTPLQEVLFDYAHSSGASSTATVAFSDGSTGTLASLGDSVTPAAFTDFAALLSGSPVAAQAFLAFGVQATRRSVEGDPGSTLDTVTRRRFDFYGNPRAIAELGDPANSNDDVTTSLAYAIADRSVSGNWLYLTSRPFSIVRNGVLGDLPAGTTLSRETQIFYDGATGDPASQALVRGNPTAIENAWTDAQGNPTFVRIDQNYDVYGNAREVSSPYDVADAGPESFTRLIYDLPSATFLTQTHQGAFGDPNFDLVTDFEYETPGCGAPNGLGLTCRITDPNEQVSTRSYDAFGRPVANTGPNGAAAAMLYHDADRGTANQRTEIRLRWALAGPADPATDPNAIAFVSFTDGLGRVLEERKTGRGIDVARRMRLYDAAGQLAELSRWDFGEAPVEPTGFTYDALGRPIAVTRPGGRIDTFNYSPGQRIAETSIPGDGLVHRRVQRVDAFDRLAAVDEYEDPSGSPATTSYAYDPFGQLVRVRDAVAHDTGLCGSNPACPAQRHATEIFYDKLGNRIRLDDPDSGTWFAEFDARGLLERSEDPRGQVQTLMYDALARLERRHAETPLEASEADDVFVYGLANTTVANGIGRLISVEDSEGSDAFEYDVAGNISFHRRDVLDRRFEFTHTYDPLGRRVVTAYPDGEIVAWTHDKALLTRIFSVGGAYTGAYVADATYDALDRPLSIELGGTTGSPVMTATHSYDPVSARLERIEAVVFGQVVGSGDYVLDGVGRVRSISATLRRLSGTVSDSPVLTYEYDGLDRLTSSGGYAQDHDALGNLVDKDVAFLSTDGAWSVMDYTDPLRPHALTHAAWTNGSRSVDYVYDPAGNVRIKKRTDSLGQANATLLYDSLGRTHRVRVSGGRTTRLRYGALGQRLGTTQWEANGDADGDGFVGTLDLDTFMAQYQAGSESGESGDFDGNLSVTTADFGILQTQFGQTLSGPSVLTPEPGFEYHTSLERVNKHFFVEGVRVASSALSWTAPLAGAPPIAPGWRAPAFPLPPGWGVAASLYGALALLVLGGALRRRELVLGMPGRRLRLGAAGTLLVVSPALLASPCNVLAPPPSTALGTHNKAALFYATDHLGSTILAVDHNGARVSRYVYMPFGDPGLWQEGVRLRHRFTGEEIVAETGFYVLGARVYDPEMGRFLQPDPLVFDPPNPQSFNRYTYALNNPMSWIDPSGLDPLPAPRGPEDGTPGPCGGLPCPGDRDILLGPGPGDSGYYAPSFGGGRGPDWSRIGHPRGSPGGVPGGLPAPSTATNVPVSQGGTPLIGQPGYSLGDRVENLVVGNGQGILGPEIAAAQGFVFRTIDDALGGVPSAVLGPVGDFLGQFDTCPDCIGGVVAIPGRPFTGPLAASRAFQHLNRFHGVDPKVASNRLHVLKGQGGLGAADNAIIGRTGDVYNPFTGERLGSLTDPGIPGLKR